MLIGILAGAGAGLAVKGLAPGAPWVEWTSANLAVPLGQVFLRLLFMLVIPLIFAALISGVVGLELKDLGRLGWRTLAYTVLVSLVAVLIGLVLVNLLRPGDGVTEAVRELARKSQAPAAAAAPAAGGSALAIVVGLIPDNPVRAAADGNMIGVIVFTLVVGIALAMTRTEPAARLRDVIQGLNDVMMTCIDGVMKLAPLAVGALLFNMAAHLGTDLIRQLAAYVGVVLLGLALHMFGVYALLLRLVGRTSPLRFFRDARLAILTAFSTSSSSATLPTTLKVAEENLGVPKATSRFVLTVGATANQNGTALFEGVTVLFLAQLYGVDLSFSQQAVVMAISVLAGVGTAGVPAGSLPALAMILKMFDIPPEGLALILGVDRLLDMCRTTLNVTGDLVAAVCLSGRERATPDR